VLYKQLTPAVFPWADRMTVRRSWSYTWRDELEEFQLPSTIDNTVSEPASPREGAGMVSQDRPTISPSATVLWGTGGAQEVENQCEPLATTECDHRRSAVAPAAIMQVNGTRAEHS
jgi:hypothetical protein